jgi:hypothetical protein
MDAAQCSIAWSFVSRLDCEKTIDESDAAVLFSSLYFSALPWLWWTPLRYGCG